MGNSICMCQNIIGGGAFVKNNNEYSDEILGKKDGFDSINKENYFIKTVKVKNSEKVFSNLFSLLISENLTNGIIKIDVEGYERKVLLAIAKTLPLSIKLSIVFENWDPLLVLDEIQKSFEGRVVKFFEFKRTIKGSKKSRIKKFLEFFFFGEKTFLINYDDDKAIIGDIIISIE